MCYSLSKWKRSARVFSKECARFKPHCISKVEYKINVYDEVLWKELDYKKKLSKD